MIKDLLTEIGYTLRDESVAYWRSNAVYRDGDNPSALRISKENGYWIDFVANESGNLQLLVEKTLNITDKDAQKIIEKYNLNNIKSITSNHSTTAPAFKHIFHKDKTIPLSWLENINSSYTSYWEDRGIDKETLKDFRGGLCSIGRFAAYYVFPIFNSKGEIIGLSGRDIGNRDGYPKWKHYLQKKFWIYNDYLNVEEIKKSDYIILLESIGDLLSFQTRGVKNTLCLFGTDISIPQINYLMKHRFNKIFICLNNDSTNSYAGNVGAQKLQTKLNKYFDRRTTKIVFPPENKKDFNDLLLSKPEYINKFNSILSKITLNTK